MCIFIPSTPAANKSAEKHQDPSEQDSFNHLLYKVLRLTSEQVQDLNDWVKHHGIPNVHELIAQSYCWHNALKNNLKFIAQGKTCYIQSNVMLSFVENPNTRLFLISCSQGILSSPSFSCYLLLRLLVYMYLSQLMRTFTNYLKCIVISS